MKKLIFAVALFSAQSSFAAGLCTHLQAQFFAKAREVIVLGENKCRVLLSWQGQWIYNPASSCPLDIDEVSSFGVITSCEVRVGDSVAGVALRPVDARPDEIILY